jgi:hypothetical protein
MVITPAAKETVRRTLTDFAIGFAAFALVAGGVAVTDGQAAITSSDAASWVTTVSYASDAGIAARLHNTQTWMWLLLALTCGGLTAFNMSIARHLRAVAIPSDHSAQRSSENLGE